jgi:hypothetical protein
MGRLGIEALEIGNAFDEIECPGSSGSAALA